MSALPDKLFVKEARQGGFTSVQLPGPLEIDPQPPSLWGLGWFFGRTPANNLQHDEFICTAISGNGSTSASFVVRTGDESNNLDIGGSTTAWVLPVREDTFLLVFQWRILTESRPLSFEPERNLGNEDDIWPQKTLTFTKETIKRGIGRKGFLISNTSASVVDVPETLATAIHEDTTALQSSQMGQTITRSQELGSRPLAITREFDPSQIQLANSPNADDLFTAALFAAIDAGAIYYHYELNSFFMIADTGGIYGDTPPDGGGNWRISIANNSGFNDAVSQVEVVTAADEGSIWLNNYTNWNGKRFYLERYIDDEWREWAGGVSILDSPVPVDPPWFALADNNEFPDGRFWPVISIPFTDRTEYFESEFGLSV
jgi:hypothetical protein